MVQKKGQPAIVPKESKTRRDLNSSQVRKKGSKSPAQEKAKERKFASTGGASREKKSVSPVSRPHRSPVAPVKYMLMLNLQYKTASHEFRVYKGESVGDVINKVLVRFKLRKKDSLVENIREQLNRQLAEHKQKL